MDKVKAALDDREKRFAVQLAERYESRTSQAEFILVADINRESNESDQDIDVLIQKFERLGLVKWHGQGKLIIQPTVLSVADQISNPPTPNYLNEITKWWFAARWRAAITVFFIFLPLLFQWYEMLQGLLSWFLGAPK